MVKNPPANAGYVRDVGSIPGAGRSPCRRDGTPLQCSCLEPPMDRGAWWAMVHGVRKSPTQLKRLSTAQKGKRVENVFDEIMAENVPNLEEETDIQVQEAQRIPNKMNPKRLNQDIL